MSKTPTGFKFVPLQIVTRYFDSEHATMLAANAMQSVGADVFTITCGLVGSTFNWRAWAKCPQDFDLDKMDEAITKAIGDGGP